MDTQAKLLLILAVIIGATGLATMLVRRKAIWTLSGQVTALKGVVLGSIAIAALVEGHLSEQLLLLSMIALTAISLLSAIGIAVLIRCQRFDGSLDYSKEQELKN